VAQQRLEEMVKNRQLESAGMLPPEALRNAAQSPLEHHLKEYVADLSALNRDGQYVYELKNRVRRLIRDCGWTVLRDITADSFQGWRAKQTLSPKTLNEYLGSISSLLNWMEKHERIARNPLQHVQKVQGNGTQVRPRRAFSDDEMQRLLAIAGARKVVYPTAVYTGLRRSELAALELGDLHSEGEKPFINARASTTKNHQQAVIALHPELLAALRLHVASLPAGGSRIFAGVMPTMKRFKADLKAAGIEFVNATGHRADFHSLRHTLATNLARAGTAPRVPMEIMRHSDMRLTAKTYTDAGLLPVADAVLKLPFLGKREAAGTQIGTQDLFREGHDLSATGTTVPGIPLLDLSENEQLGREKESPVQTGQTLEMVRGTGFEPVTFRV
jgi:integrase